LTGWPPPKLVVISASSEQLVIRIPNDLPLDKEQATVKVGERRVDVRFVRQP
jgi:hypothetical protein